MAGPHAPLAGQPAGELPNGARPRGFINPLPTAAFQPSPWANNAEITTSNPAWRIADAGMPVGTETIRIYLIGAGGDADVSGVGIGAGGGGGGGTSVKTIHRTGGLDALVFVIDLAAGGSEADSTLLCSGLGVRMVAGAGKNGVLGSGGVGGTASGGDFHLVGGSGGDAGAGTGGGGGGGAGAHYGDGGNGGTSYGTYGAGGGGIAGDGGDGHDHRGGGGGAITPAILDQQGRGNSPGGSSFDNLGDGSEGRITGDPDDGEYGAGGGGGHGDGGAGGTFGGGGGAKDDSRGDDGGYGGGGGGGGANHNHRGFGGGAFVVVEWN